MSAAPKLPVSMDSYLEVTTVGGQKRRLYIDKPVITVGRDIDNDLSLSDDPKVSRKHCEIIKQADGRYLVRNISQKNFVYINGEEIMQKFVDSSCRLRVGEQEFDLVIPEKTATYVPAKEISVKNISNKDTAASHYSPPPLTSVQTKSFNKIYLVVGVLVIAGLWSYLSGPNEKKDALTIRTEDKIAMEVKESQDKIKTLTEKIEKSGEQTLQYKSAQEHYIKGFRDYRQGQYARAMSSFQAALAFYPAHELARKYLSLSKRKFDEQVQQQMILGRRYKGKNNYRLCKSSFASVMVMMKDPTDPIYKEAKQYYEECSLLLEGRY